jgi:hypothetical protein
LDSFILKASPTIPFLARLICHPDFVAVGDTDFSSEKLSYHAEQ